MVQGTPGTRFTGSALVRLLAQLAELNAPDSKPAFAERLAQWLGWTHAISLSAALNSRPPAGAQPLSRRPLSAGSAPSEVQRLRSAMAAAIADDFAPPPAGKAARAPAMNLPSDFPSIRRRYAARQQAMELAIAALRERVRDAVARASPALARLAAVDAVMEQVLGAQEQALLFSLPTMLEKRFERLRPADADTQGPPDGSPGPWLAAFCQDVQAVLLAELDLRLQPVQALLEALPAPATTTS